MPTQTSSQEVSSTDINDFSTLAAVRNDLADSINGLDKWHAFDLKADEMTVKQQIKAHQLAYDILSPLLETIDSTLLGINQRFKQR